MILFPGADHSPKIRFKTIAVILAVVQRLLSYNNCRGIQLLRSGNFSWLLHLPGKTEMAGSISRGLRPGKLIFASVINRILLLTLAGDFSNLLLQLRGASNNKKLNIITFL